MFSWSTSVFDDVKECWEKNFQKETETNDDYTNDACYFGDHQDITYKVDCVKKYSLKN